MTAIPILLAAAFLAPAADAPLGVRFEVGDMPVRVLEERDEHLIVEFLDQPGSRAEVARESVPGEVLYQVAEQRIDPATADDWLRLAEIADEHSQPLRRLEALRRARDLGADVGPRIDAARQACAADRVRRARTLLDAGETTVARHHLENTIARFAPCDAVSEARTLLEDIEAEREAERIAQSPPSRKRVTELVGEGRALIREGQRTSDDYVESTERFEAALDKLREADERLEAAGDDIEDDESEDDHSLRAIVDDLLVRAHVELGYAYLARGKHKDAYHHATLAASVDPTAPTVSDLRQAIGAADAVVTTTDGG